jgi:hypothetical protein
MAPVRFRSKIVAKVMHRTPPKELMNPWWGDRSSFCLHHPYITQAHYKLTRECLRCAGFGSHSIITKSAMIRRDIDGKIWTRNASLGVFFTIPLRILSGGRGALCTLPEARFHAMRTCSRRNRSWHWYRPGDSGLSNEILERNAPRTLERRRHLLLCCVARQCRTYFEERLRDKLPTRADRS